MPLNKVIATIVAGTVQLGVQSWMFSNIKWAPVSSTSSVSCSSWIRNMCSPTQVDGYYIFNWYATFDLLPFARFVCPTTQVFGTASIIVRCSLSWNPNFTINTLFSGVSISAGVSSNYAHDDYARRYRTCAAVFQGTDILVCCVSIWMIHFPQAEYSYEAVSKTLNTRLRAFSQLGYNRSPAIFLPHRLHYPHCLVGNE
jgi:hypothetical protein